MHRILPKKLLEPGKSLHQAVHHRVLDPEAAGSKPFVRWFRRLFSV